MRVLVVGGSGYLGGKVVRQALASSREVVATYLTRPGDQPASWHRLEVRDRGQVLALLARLRPDVVVNAAYQQSDWASTADGAAHVAVAAASTEARLVHVSSNAVFSGYAARYDERAVPDPATAYGGAKAAAQTVVRAISPGSVVARTSLIVGSDGRSSHERRVHALSLGAAPGALFTDDVRVRRARQRPRGGTARARGRSVRRRPPRRWGRCDQPARARRADRGSRRPRPLVPAQRTAGRQRGARAGRRPAGLHADAGAAEHAAARRARVLAPANWSHERRHGPGPGRHR